MRAALIAFVLACASSAVAQAPAPPPAFDLYSRGLGAAGVVAITDPLYCALIGGAGMPGCNMADAGMRFSGRGNAGVSTQVSPLFGASYHPLLLDGGTDDFIEMTADQYTDGLVYSYRTNTADVAQVIAATDTGAGASSVLRSCGATEATCPGKAFLLLYSDTAAIAENVIASELALRLSFKQANAGYDYTLATNEFLGAIATEVVINEPGANRDFRVEGDTETDVLFVDASTDRVGIGLVAPTAKLHIEDGTVPDGLRSFLNTATISSTGTQTAAQFNVSISGAGTSGDKYGVFNVLSGAYTGAFNNFGSFNSNATQGTAALGFLSIVGNAGGGFNSSGSTAGHNFGLISRALNSSTLNVGSLSSASTSSAGANVGVIGNGVNNGAGPQVGGFFTMHGTDFNPAFVDAVLISDNENGTSTGAFPLFLGRVNGATSFSVGGTGAVVANETGAAVDFRVESDTNANAILVTGASNAVSLLTSTASAGDISIGGDVLPTAADTTDIGGAALGLRTAYVDTSIVGADNGKALLINDLNGVTVSGGAFTADSGVNILQPELSSASAPSYVRFGATVSTAPVKPACDTANEGAMIYVDDTDDAVTGQLCSCNASVDRLTFSWLNQGGIACAGT